MVIKISEIEEKFGDFHKIESQIEAIQMYIGNNIESLNLNKEVIYKLIKYFKYNNIDDFIDALIDRNFTAFDFMSMIKYMDGDMPPEDFYES